MILLWLILIPDLVLAQQLRDPLSTTQSSAAFAEPRQTIAPVTIVNRAQDATVDGQADGADLLIGAVSVTGSEPIGLATLSASYEPFIGRTASPEVLQQLARSVAEESRRRGYLFASAVVPAQAVQLGVVKVRLDLGAIDEVRITGSENRRLRQIFDRLIGKAPLKSHVERQLLLAEDLPGITILGTRYEKKDGRGVLAVEVDDQKLSTFVVLDNYGPTSVGPLRVRLSTDVNGLFNAGDTLNAQILNTVHQPDELTFVSGRYAVTPGGGASQFGVTASAGVSRPGGDLSRFELEGRSLYAAVFVSRALVRTKDASVWVNAELAHLKFKEKAAGVLLQRDEIVTVSAGASGNVRIAKSQLSGGVGIVRGVAASGTNRRGDPLSSRLDASGVFTKGTVWVNWTAPLGERYRIRASVNGQTTSRPLLASQEIGVGGPGFGRAYDFSERFGDRGVMGAIELRKELGDGTPLARDVQIYTVVDGGSVGNIGQGFGGGSVYSAGAGARGRIGRADFAVEVAAPLNADRFRTADRSPRVNVSVRWRF